MGGDKWTLMFMRSFKDKIFKLTNKNIDVETGPEILMLKDKFRDAKEKLSTVSKVFICSPCNIRTYNCLLQFQIMVPNFFTNSKGQSQTLVLPVTRAEYEAVVMDDFKIIIHLIADCFQNVSKCACLL